MTETFAAMFHAFFQRWKSKRSARAAAIVFFRKTTGKMPIASMILVIAADDTGIVVRVCSGQTCPPHRDWLKVKPDGSVVTVDWEEARQLGERPWR